MAMKTAAEWAQKRPHNRREREEFIREVQRDALMEAAHIANDRIKTSSEIVERIMALVRRLP